MFLFHHFLSFSKFIFTSDCLDRLQSHRHLIPSPSFITNVYFLKVLHQLPLSSQLLIRATTHPHRSIACRPPVQRLPTPLPDVCYLFNKTPYHVQPYFITSYLPMKLNLQITHEKRFAFTSHRSSIQQKTLSSS